MLLYRTQIDALRNLSAEQFKASLLAIADYGMDGKIPDGDPVAVAMWMMAKPLIDKNNKRYENGTEGGRPKTKQKPNDNQTETKPEPTCNLKDKGERIKNKDIKDIKDILSGKPNSEYQYKEVIEYLNQKTGKAFKDQSKDSRRLIKARFDEGYTLDDFKKVIDNKVAAWGGDPKMDEYLRPATLFSTKFEGYLNEKPKHDAKPANRFCNFAQRDYDFAELERQLIGG